MKFVNKKIYTKIIGERKNIYIMEKVVTKNVFSIFWSKQKGSEQIKYTSFRA